MKPRSAGDFRRLHAWATLNYAFGVPPSKRPRSADVRICGTIAVAEPFGRLL